MNEVINVSDVDDFDEWEDVELDLDDYQYSIELPSVEKSDNINIKSQLSKLTRQYKTEYVQESIKIHKLQAIVSIVHLKNFVLNNFFQDIKTKAIIPGIIRKKFKQKNNDIGKLVNLIKGFAGWFQNNYVIDMQGQRPITKQYARDLVFTTWFTENKDLLQKLHSTSKTNFHKLENHYKKIFEKKEKSFGRLPRIDLDLKSKNNNSKEEYVLKFFLLLRHLLQDKHHLHLQLIFNIPCLNVKKVLNDCALKSLTDIIMENHDIDDISGIKRAIDFDLYFPYMWIELNIDECVYYINPIKFGKLTDFVYRNNINEPFKPFHSFDSVSPFDFENPSYIFSIDSALNLENVSSRYIPNLQFTASPCLINLKNDILWNLNKDIWNIVREIFKDFEVKSSDLSYLRETYTETPKILKMYKRNPNFIVDQFGCFRNYLEIPVGANIDVLLSNKTLHKVYFKSQLKRLRTKAHWQVLGRDVMEGATHRKFKTHRASKDYHSSKITVPLFTFDQTFPTPRIKTLPTLNSYRKTLKGIDMLKIFNEQTMLPHGYKLISNQEENKNFINKKLLNRFNKRDFRNHIDSLEVITGFKFLPKNQVKPITKFMITDLNYQKLTEFYKLIVEIEQLNNWNQLILRLVIKERIQT
ncbi:hypothetical protein QEN19_001196 [Hanseniaspora menglaensis]